MPWIANLATLVVVVAAIGWSSEQRPAVQVAEVAQAPQALPIADPTPPAISPAPHTRWTSQTTALTVDGLQVVSLQTSKLR